MANGCPRDIQGTRGLRVTVRQLGFLLAQTLCRARPPILQRERDALDGDGLKARDRPPLFFNVLSAAPLQATQGNSKYFSPASGGGSPKSGGISKSIRGLKARVLAKPEQRPGETQEHSLGNMVSVTHSRGAIDSTRHVARDYPRHGRGGERRFILSALRGKPVSRGVDLHDTHSRPSKAIWPLDEQRRIVEELDAEAAQIETVRALIPRFESKIQRVLDRVWGEKQ